MIDAGNFLAGDRIRLNYERGNLSLWRQGYVYYVGKKHLRLSDLLPEETWWINTQKIKYSEIIFYERLKYPDLEKKVTEAVPKEI